ncbi:hypothetical protein ACFQBQ_02375 [Granulicella cerasi]|uniref:Uncharacterized protein n=1 Tax=Granulicella cerasi TaxID=741063 RepID=A0ABW1Z7I7_9BACT|nr:hypothetical protein [Granulicella cerasi]
MDAPSALNFIPNWLQTLIAAGAGAFLASYLKRKGENIAVREELEELVKQVKATTEATKAIEARIGDEFWNKQRMWEMKRDALVESFSDVAAIDDAFMAYIGSLQLKNEAAAFEFAQKLVDTLEGSFVTRAKANLLCGNEINIALLEFMKQVTTAKRLFDNGTLTQTRHVPASLYAALRRVEEVIRVELGFES